ncbi:MAG: hypothetical protein RIR62_299, partial [Pseudomonadota bacterium]
MLKSGRRLLLRVANRVLPENLYVAAEHSLYHFAAPLISTPRTFSEYIHHRK